MRVFLFICLLSLFACNTDIKETFMCLISNPKVQAVGLKILNLLYNKEYEQILPTVLASIPELKAAFLECTVEKENDEVVLKDDGCRDWWGYAICAGAFGPYSSQQYIQQCYEIYCK